MLIFKRILANLFKTRPVCYLEIFFTHFFHQICSQICIKKILLKMKKNLVLPPQSYDSWDSFINFFLRRLEMKKLVLYFLRSSVENKKL